MKKYYIDKKKKTLKSARLELFLFSSPLPFLIWMGSKTRVWILRQSRASGMRTEAGLD